MKCQVCDSENVEEFLDLGEQPICNRFLKSSNESEKKYPLKVAFCHDCTLVQLTEMPPSSEIWNSDYSYLTGTTPEAREYFDVTAYALMKKYKLKPDDLVMDIGSNDGTFLAYMKIHGMNVLGIEPSPKCVDEALNWSVPTIAGVFEDVWKEVVTHPRQPKLITAFNVIAHTDRIHEFLDAVTRFDAPFVSQSHYLPRMIEWNEYDTIYHEHARYYTLTSLRNLFEKHGLGIADVDEVEYYGGSLVVHAKQGKSSPYFWKDYIEEPYKYIEKYKQFADRVFVHKLRLNNMLNELAGFTIIGAGAPMKCSTMLNYCGIDNNCLDYIIERNKFKIGTYTPGTHIPVVAYDAIKEKQPDYILILAWNAARSIMQILRDEYNYKGHFIIPIPEPRII